MWGNIFILFEVNEQTLKTCEKVSRVPRPYLENCLVNPSIHIPKNSIKKASTCWNMQATGCSSQGSDLLKAVTSFQLLPFLHLWPPSWKLILNPLVLFYTLSWVVLLILLTSNTTTNVNLTLVPTPDIVVISTSRMNYFIGILNLTSSKPKLFLTFLQILIPPMPLTQ